MEFLITEQGTGYGPDYGQRFEDGDHTIYAVSEITGAGLFFLHRFESAGRNYSAVYTGHYELIRVEEEKEQEMLEYFLVNRERYYRGKM